MPRPQRWSQTLPGLLENALFCRTLKRPRSSDGTATLSASKLFFLLSDCILLDVEATGLDPRKHEVIRCASNGGRARGLALSSYRMYDFAGAYSSSARPRLLDDASSCENNQ